MAETGDCKQNHSTGVHHRCKSMLHLVPYDKRNDIVTFLTNFNFDPSMKFRFL